MSNSYPTLLNESTRLCHPTTRSQSSSPSRSPLRKAQFAAQEIDPLLSNLSPCSTLKALSLTDALGAKQPKDADDLTRSIAEASKDERAFGIRAAVAAQKLREWHAEVVGWKWPAKRDRSRGKGFEPRPSASTREMGISPNGKSKQFLGSLPATVVAQHEERIDQIRDGLEALGVDELKEHVLRAHNPSRPEKGSTESSHHGVVQLSDFTAVITHTMLQALPYLSKLTTLLHHWDSRIIVLKQVPHLLRHMDEVENSIESALASVGTRRTSGLLTRTRFADRKATLEHDICLLGATFDKLLDQLEGREDSLPETWVDRMDQIEASFARWTVEAERKLLYNEWMEQNRMSLVERQRKKEASETIEGTTPTEEIILRANNQSQSSKDSDERIRNEISVGLEPQDEHEHELKGHAMVNQLPETDARTITSATAPESQSPSAVNKEPLASLPGDGRDGETPQTQAGPCIIPTGSVYLTSAPERAEVMKEQLLNMNFPQQEAFVIPPIPSFNQPSLPPTPSRHHLEEETQGPGGIAGPAVDDVDASVARQDPSESVSSSTVQVPDENPSGIRPLEGDPVEPNAELFNQHYALSPRNGGSCPISRPNMKRPLTLTLPQSRHRKRVSEVSIAQSEVSEAFSDLSDVEIVDATAAAVLGSPKMVSHAVRASRDDLSNSFAEAEPRVQSLHPPRPEMAFFDLADRSNKAASTSLERLRSSFPMPIKASDTVSDDEDDGEDEDKDEGQGYVEASELITNQSRRDTVMARRPVMRRASMSSTEQIQKHRIRDIMVHRGHSAPSSAVSAISPIHASEAYELPAPVRSVSPSGIESSASLSKETPLGQRSGAVECNEGISPPVKTAGSPYSPVEPDPTKSPSLPRRSSKRVVAAPSAGLGLTLRCGTPDLDPSMGSPLYVDAVGRGGSPATSPSKVMGDDKLITLSKGKIKGHEDLLEAKIQRLLTDIPARIRLLSDSDAESRSHPSTASSSRSQSPIPSIILSPVKAKRHLQPNSDVRIFHLSRSTESRNTPPMKLFVRLVGEDGERVMVRVGGGWADLGDYLRDYSLHHSQRGFSHGRFELASLPVSGQKDRKDPRVIPFGPELISKATTAGSPLPRFRSPSNTRPGSAMDHRVFANVPFGIHKPKTPRRSTSAHALRASHVQDPSLPQPMGSDDDSINTSWKAPPLPFIPHARTLNPYFGGDSRSTDPSRQTSAVKSPSSVLKPTPTPLPFLATPAPAADFSSQPKRQRLTSLNYINTSSKSKLKSTHQMPGSGQPIAPAASRITLDHGYTDRNGDSIGDCAPAPTIGSTYSMAPATGKRATTTNPKSRITSLGEVGVGGIRRVFFRRKMAT